MSGDSDPNKLRDVEIKRLVKMAELAYKNAMDQELKMRTRESWHQKYTNTVLALNQLLKDLQYKDYEKRLKLIEESGTRPRRPLLSKDEVRRRIASATRKELNKRPSRTSWKGGEA